MENATTVQTGESLSCEASSNPTITKYEWRNSENALMGQSQSIQLGTEQIGRHTLACTVTNYMGRNWNIQGTDTVTLSLNVIGRLAINISLLHG